MTNHQTDSPIIIGFLYGIQSDMLKPEEVKHRVAGFRHTQGYKEALALLQKRERDADTSKVDRFEVIDETGRTYVKQRRNSKMSNPCRLSFANGIHPEVECGACGYRISEHTTPLSNTEELEGQLWEVMNEPMTSANAMDMLDDLTGHVIAKMMPFITIYADDLATERVIEARNQAIEDVKKAGYGYDDGTGFVLKISYAELSALKATLKNNKQEKEG